MYELVNYLDKHPTCCGVTGRPRAMTRGDQGVSGIEWRLSTEYLLRLTQLYDFELAGSVLNPTYHLLGFLPVFPDPCGLYRGSDVLQDCIQCIASRISNFCIQILIIHYS